MNRENYLKIITDYLGTLSYQVKYRNSINLYDINIIAESFYKDLLNKIFKYNLKNLNAVEKNASAIDLGDEEKRIAIQVTSDSKSTKIKKSIEKFIEYKWFEKYDRLIILILTNKKKYSTEFDTQGKFDFNIKSDVIDGEDLIKMVNEYSPKELKDIAQFLEDELLEKVNQRRKIQATEVETVIDLIEFITQHKISSKKRLNTFVDPDHKINKRFKEYSEFLKNMYANLFVIYNEPIEEAKNVLGIDDVNEILINTFLMDISNNYLNENNGDCKEALDRLTEYFAKELEKIGKKYDFMAIKFYLISEIINCNVFPNIKEEVVQYE
ncbi:SMEK domain-containing protein [Clostridium paraputrificum]|uniref:SMEK domain-containing protein n=1 Tax=Clostridium paraputrificum TaxID=29363 RepID=UPI000C085C5A|nr:SMEK domain-containing protein [Clostridium paraputrificum]